MYNKIKKCTIVASIMAVNNLHSMQNLFNIINNISNNISNSSGMQQIGQVGQHFSNFMNSQQGQQIIQCVDNAMNSQIGQQVQQNIVNIVNNTISDSKEYILGEINKKVLFTKTTEKNIIYIKKTQNKDGRLVIYIPGKDETISQAEGTITNAVKGNIYLKNADIMLLDYHNNTGNVKENFWHSYFKNKNYKKDILKLDNFFDAVRNSIFYENTLTHIKEVIIMGYSLGCLYANKLVDKIYEGYFENFFNTDVTVSLIMIKPFINLFNCLENFIGFKINSNNALVEDLKLKTSNYEILKNRCIENRYNTRKPILICCQKKEDHGITSEDIEHCLNFYNDTVYTKSVDGLCYKRSLTIILTGEYDNIVGNSIVEELSDFNGLEMCY